MVNQFDRLRAALADRYLLDRELGGGGMATVYLATDLKHHRRVALKVLRPDIVATLGSARFLREIEIAAGLVHPHILSLHDSGEADGLLFFVMPYVDGESLRDRLKREGRLSLDEAVRVVREVADALSHAHSRGVVHRDIKPENILFESGHAIVSDFGVARAVTAAGDDSVTATGVVVGTPAYMSPEQAIGDRELDSRCDIYSLACVAYEMLSGERPFAAPSAQAVLTRKLTEEPTGLRSVVRDIPENVEAVVAKAMARSPADRYATAKEFSTALQQAVTGTSSPVRARGPWRISRRTALLLSLAAAGLVAAVALWRAGQAAPPPVKAIAVLPFTSPASDSTPAYFIEGMHDEVIGELGRITNLRVISRTSVMSVRAPNKTIQQMARELGVDALVEGALYRSKDSVRIQIRLVRALPEERQLWSHTYHTDARQLMSLQSDVARGIVDQLRAALSSGDGVRPAGASDAPRDGAVNPAAYDAYLQGRYWLNRRTPEGMARAETEFRRSLALDPNFAGAHAGLAMTLALAVDFHYERIDPFAVSRAAIEEANRALALDSLSADALAARGRVLSNSHAPEALVRRDFERAIAIAPHHANAHGWYAMELAWRGRAAESRAENDKAIALDPLSPGRHQGFAISAVNLGDLEVALREARRVVLLEPTLTVSRSVEGLALLSLGRAEECLSVPLGRFLSVRAMCLHSVGRVAEGRRLADSVAAVAMSAIRKGGPYAVMLHGDNLAMYYAWIGDVDATLHWFREAMAISTASAPNLYINTKAFDPVRRVPRFNEELAKINEDIWRRVNTPPIVR